MEYIVSGFNNQDEVIKAVMQLRPVILPYIFSMVGSMDDAEDVFQDAAIAMFHKWEQMKDGGNLKAWCNAFARRTALAWLRKHRRKAVISDEFVLDKICDYEPDSLMKDDLVNALKSCLGKLPEKSRDLIVMRYTRKMSCDKIGRVLNRPVDSIYVTLSKVRNALKRCVNLTVR